MGLIIVLTTDGGIVQGDWVRCFFTEGFLLNISRAVMPSKIWMIRYTRSPFSDYPHNRFIEKSIPVLHPYQHNRVPCSLLQGTLKFE